MAKIISALNYSMFNDPKLVTAIIGDKNEVYTTSNKQLYAVRMGPLDLLNTWFLLVSLENGFVGDKIIVKKVICIF